MRITKTQEIVIWAIITGLLVCCLILLAACFIAGDCNVMQWNPGGRFFITVLSAISCSIVGVNAYHSIFEEKRRR